MKGQSVKVMAAFATGLLVVSVALSVVRGQAVPRTPWGDPDLQGIWNDGTRTPLERPAEFGDREFLTDEEFTKISNAFKRDAELRALPEARRPSSLPIDLPAFTAKDQPPAAEDATGSGPDDWYEGITLTSRRTSLVIDPPNGHLPPLTPEAQQARATGRERARLLESWEALPPWQRCITRGVPGNLMPTAYNNNYQIFQARGYMVILTEMIHDARIIPLDGSPHLPPAIRQWNGNSRGHWEGDTLVVETTNFDRRSPGVSGGGTMSDKATVIEHFKRVDSHTIDYRFTIDDPLTLTRPFTVALPMTNKGSEVPDQILEYACHEGNRVVFMILSGARAEEKRAASGKTRRHGV